ncbi:MAG: MFS transporter, partial [Blautia sp.]
QFLLPFCISYVAVHNLPFHTIFLATAVLITVDGIFLCFLPFPPFEKKAKGAPREKMKFTPSTVLLICLGFTTSTTFMLWLNCNQELGTLYGLSDPSKIQSLYSVGIVLALFTSAVLLGRNIAPVNILIVSPRMSLLTLIALYLIQIPGVCLVGGFLLGFFAAGGVLQLVTAIANEMFPRHRGVITSLVMIASSVANYMVLNVAGFLTRLGGLDGPRLVLLFNAAVTFIGICLALILRRRMPKDFEPQTASADQL